MKKFSKELFDKYDEAAREVAKEWLTEEGWTVRDNPDKYGIDLIATKGDAHWDVEVEVRASWTGDFPYKTLQLPERKAKFAKPNTIFLVFASDFQHFYAVTAETLKLCGFVQKDTKFTEGELFFDVPLKFAFLYSVKNPSS